GSRPRSRRRRTQRAGLWCHIRRWPRRAARARRRAQLETDRETDTHHRVIAVVANVVLGLRAFRFQVRVERRWNQRGIGRVGLNAKLRRALIKNTQVERQTETAAARLSSPADAEIRRSLVELYVSGDVADRSARICHAIDGDRSA